MQQLRKYIIASLALVAATIGASAQDNGSSSSSIVRRGGADRGKQQSQSEAQVTQRMQSFFEEQPQSDADRMWMRVIYRQLDLDNPKNAALYFPEETIDGQENLFRIIMRLLANNQIPAYEYLDGREIFNDQYRLKVRDMLDRFHIIYADAKGSSEKNPKFTIEESDVPANEVLSYYILERWEFDSRSNRTRTTVEAICPVLHRSGDFGGEAVKYPMFWVKLDALRPYLAQQSIFVDDDNNLAKYTYDDFFQLTMYEGDIYKTRNLANKSMMQLYPDPDDRKRAQDSIQNRLETFDKKMWVPSREEVIAMREAREAAEAKAKESKIKDRDADSDDEAIDEATTDSEEKTSVRRSSRGSKAKGSAKKEPKAKASKAPKAKKAKAPKKSSGGAARSVRRTK